MSKTKNTLSIFSPEDSRDFQLKVEEYGELPEEYLPEKRIPVTNQWRSSSCVSHALSTAMSYCELRQGYDESNIYSKGFIYANRDDETDYSEGMVTREAIKVLHKEGDCLHHQFRWHMSRTITVSKAFQKRKEELESLALPYKIAAYYRLSSDEDIKKAVYYYGAAVMAYPMRKSNGAYIEAATDKITGSHAITVIGWDKTGWWLQNSWGKLYGKRGLYHMSYDYDWRECWTFEVAQGTKRQPAPAGSKILDFFQFFKEIFLWVFGKKK